MANESDEWIERLPNWVMVPIYIASASLLLYIFVGSYLHGNVRDTNPRYTIGHVTSTSYVVGPNSHSVAFFTYVVGDSTYRQSSAGDLPTGCTRCLVKYAAADPTNFEFFNRVCIPDSIASAPAQGWEKPPFVTAAKAL